MARMDPNDPKAHVMIMNVPRKLLIETGPKVKMSFRCTEGESIDGNPPRDETADPNKKAFVLLNNAWVDTSKGRLADVSIPKFKYNNPNVPNVMYMTYYRQDGSSAVRSITPQDLKKAFDATRLTPEQVAAQKESHTQHVDLGVVDEGAFSFDNDDDGIDY